MAKKTPKNAKSNELDGKEFFAAISLIEKEKGIPKSYMLDKIAQALVSAYKRDHEGITDNVFIDANEANGTVRMYVKKEIVEEVDNPYTEIALEEARKTLPTAQTGDVVRIEIKPRNFGYWAHQKFVPAAEESGWDVTHYEKPGATHEWGFWDEQIRYFIPWMLGEK